MKTALKFLLPVGILTVGAGVLALMILNRPKVTPEPKAIAVPLVRVAEVHRQPYRFRVEAQGSVRPNVDLLLTAEVAGRVIEVAPSFDAGGFFEKGDVLVTLDPRDYEVAVTRSRAQLAEAQVRVQREQAEADVARKEWETLGGKGAPNALLLREPQLAEARAVADSAAAALAQAELDLERCRIRAPFAGRIWEKRVDAGQYVKKGDHVARIYSVDFAEVRLPIPLEDVVYLELPLDASNDPDHGPEVRLRTRFGTENLEWNGRIVRTEGEIDPRTRMVTAIARVADPYRRQTRASGAPLAVGLFVEAEIRGRDAGEVYVIPRAAMRGPETVIVVDAESRLQFRAVKPLRFEFDRAVIDRGLEPGDRVCISPLDAPVAGRAVRVVEEGE